MGISMLDFLYEYFMNQLYEFVAVVFSFFFFFFKSGILFYLVLICKRERWCWSCALGTVRALTRVGFCVVT